MLDPSRPRLALCTLFNVNYLDKGLVLYDSLEKVSGNFVLYVLAMDDRCYGILSELNRKNLIPIRLSDFEDEDLLRVKPNRKGGEYFYTCTPFLIKYVMQEYGEQYCAYIDADMYFYSDPVCLLDEMFEHGASVLLVGHRFNDFERRKMEWSVGRFCVEFNLFDSSEKAWRLLNLWASQCLEHCSLDNDGIHYGDQKYLDKWVEDYPCVMETRNMGAGVAPWNINQYTFDPAHPDDVVYKGEPVPLVFYHFENIRYISRTMIDINVYHYWGIQAELVNRLYIPYLKELDNCKGLLQEKFGFFPLLSYHPGKNDRPDKKFLLRVKFFISHFFLDKESRSIYFNNVIPVALFRKRNQVLLSD